MTGLIISSNFPGFIYKIDSSKFTNKLIISIIYMKFEYGF